MERLYIEIRFVQGTDDDFNELSDMFCGDADGFCEGNSQPVIDYLSQWDDGEIEPTTEKPRIARGDTAYADENGIYTLLYNSSVGGVFLLYRLATEREINEYYSNGKGSLSESNKKSNNMKRKITLTESQLKQVIENTIRNILQEGKYVNNKPKENNPLADDSSEASLKSHYRRFNHHDYNSLPRSQKDRETRILELKLKKMGFSESCIDETCTVFYYNNDMSIQDGIEYAKWAAKDSDDESITYQDLLRSKMMSNPLGYLK